MYQDKQARTSLLGGRSVEWATRSYLRLNSIYHDQSQSEERRMKAYGLRQQLGEEMSVWQTDYAAGGRGELYRRLHYSVDFTDRAAERAELEKRLKDGELIRLPGAAYNLPQRQEGTVSPAAGEFNQDPYRPEEIRHVFQNVAGKGVYMAEHLQPDGTWKPLPDSQAPVHERTGFASPAGPVGNPWRGVPRPTAMGFGTQFLGRQGEKVASFLPGVAGEMLEDTEMDQLRMHTLGLEPYRGVDNLVNPDGSMAFDVRHENDWFGLGGGSGFLLDKELGELDADIDDPERLRAHDILTGEAQTREDGTRFVETGTGEQVPLIDLAEGVSIKLPDGSMHQINRGNLQEIQFQRDGGWGDTVLGKLVHGGGAWSDDGVSSNFAGEVFQEVGFTLDRAAEMAANVMKKVDWAPSIWVYNKLAEAATGKKLTEYEAKYAESFYVDTPMGPMGIPQITGDRMVDRELMMRPEFQRAVLDYHGTGFYAFMQKAGQTALFLADFGMVSKGVNAGMAGVGGAVKMTGGALKGSRAGAWVAGAAQNPIIKFGTKTAGTWKRAVGGGAEAATHALPIRTTLSGVGEFMKYDAARNVITGDGTVIEGMESGLKSGFTLWGAGYAARFGRKTIARTLGPLLQAAGKGTGLTTVAGAGRTLRASYSAKEELASGLPEGYWSAQVEQGLAKLSSLRNRGAVQGVMAEAEAFIEKDLAPRLRAAGTAEVIDSALTGLLFGAYGSARQQAAEQGLDWSNLSQTQVVDMVANAFSDPRAIAEAVVFGGHQFKHSWHQSKGPAWQKLGGEGQELYARTVMNIVEQTLRHEGGLRDVAAVAAEAVPQALDELHAALAAQDSGDGHSTGEFEAAMIETARRERSTGNLLNSESEADLHYTWAEDLVEIYNDGPGRGPEYVEEVARRMTIPALTEVLRQIRELPIVGEEGQASQMSARGVRESVVRNLRQKREILAELEAQAEWDRREVEYINKVGEVYGEEVDLELPKFEPEAEKPEPQAMRREERDSYFRKARMVREGAEENSPALRLKSRDWMISENKENGEWEVLNRKTRKKHGRSLERKFETADEAKDFILRESGILRKPGITNRGRRRTPTSELLPKEQQELWDIRNGKATELTPPQTARQLEKLTEERRMWQEQSVEDEYLAWREEVRDVDWDRPAARRRIKARREAAELAQFRAERKAAKDEASRIRAEEKIEAHKRRIAHQEARQAKIEAELEAEKKATAERFKKKNRALIEAKRKREAEEDGYKKWQEERALEEKLRRAKRREELGLVFGAMGEAPEVPFGSGVSITSGGAREVQPSAPEPTQAAKRSSGKKKPELTAAGEPAQPKAEKPKKPKKLKHTIFSIRDAEIVAEAQEFGSLAEAEAAAKEGTDPRLGDIPLELLLAMKGEMLYSNAVQADEATQSMLRSIETMLEALPEYNQYTEPGEKLAALLEQDFNPSYQALQKKYSQVKSRYMQVVGGRGNPAPVSMGRKESTSPTVIVALREAERVESGGEATAPEVLDAELRLATQKQAILARAEANKARVVSNAQVLAEAARRKAEAEKQTQAQKRTAESAQRTAEQRERDAASRDTEQLALQEAIRQTAADSAKAMEREARTGEQSVEELEREALLTEAFAFGNSVFGDEGRESKEAMVPEVITVRVEKEDGSSELEIRHQVGKARPLEREGAGGKKVPYGDRTARVATYEGGEVRTYFDHYRSWKDAIAFGIKHAGDVEAMESMATGILYRYGFGSNNSKAIEAKYLLVEALTGLSRQQVVALESQVRNNGRFRFERFMATEMGVHTRAVLSYLFHPAKEAQQYEESGGVGDFKLKSEVQELLEYAAAGSEHETRSNGLAGEIPTRIRKAKKNTGHTSVEEELRKHVEELFLLRGERPSASEVAALEHRLEMLLTAMTQGRNEAGEIVSSMPKKWMDVKARLVEKAITNLEKKGAIPKPGEGKRKARSSAAHKHERFGGLTTEELVENLYMVLNGSQGVGKAATEGRREGKTMSLDYAVENYSESDSNSSDESQHAEAMLYDRSEAKPKAQVTEDLLMDESEVVAGPTPRKNSRKARRSEQSDEEGRVILSAEGATRLIGAHNKMVAVFDVLRQMHHMGANGPVRFISDAVDRDIRTLGLNSELVQTQLRELFNGTEQSKAWFIEATNIRGEALYKSREEAEQQYELTRAELLNIVESFQKVVARAAVKMKELQGPEVGARVEKALGAFMTLLAAEREPGFTSHSLSVAEKLNQANPMTFDLTGRTPWFDIVEVDGARIAILTPEVKEVIGERLKRAGYSVEESLAGDYPSMPFFSGLASVASLGFDASMLISGFLPHPTHKRTGPMLSERLRIGKFAEAVIRNSGDWQKNTAKRVFGKAVLKMFQTHWSVLARGNSGTLTVEQRRIAGEYKGIRVYNDAAAAKYMSAMNGIMQQLDKLQLTSVQHRLLAKAIDGGAYMHFRTPELWAKHFGKGSEGMFHVMQDIVHLFNDVGREMVNVGLLSPEAYAARMNRYLPRTTRKEEKELDERYRGMLSAGMSVVGANERTRDKDSSVDDAMEEFFNLKDVLPAAITRETSRVTFFKNMGSLLAEGRAISSEEYEKLSPGEKLMWRKAAEDNGLGQLSPSEQRRLEDPSDTGMTEEHATKIVQRRLGRISPVQVRSEMMRQLESSANGETVPETQAKKDLLERWADAYIPTHSLYEMDLMLDMMDPGNRMVGLHSTIQSALDAWKGLKTFKNPSHWYGNFTTSIATNHMTGRLDMIDFARSVMTGKGFYAEAFNDIGNWLEWVSAGRPFLEDTALMVRNQKTQMFADRMGSGTLISSAFDAKDLGSYLLQFMNPDGRAINTQSSTMLDEAVSVALTRGIGSLQRLDRTISFARGDQAPQLQAEAEREVMRVYQGVELAFKLAPALKHMQEGGTLEEAVSWSASGTADYANRNPRLYKMASRFRFQMTEMERMATRQAGKSEGARSAARFMGKMAMGPFWTYNMDMIPTLGASVLNDPLRFATGVAASIAFNRLVLSAAAGGGLWALSGGDDQDERSEQLRMALANTPGYEFKTLSPQAYDYMIDKHGDEMISNFTHFADPSGAKIPLHRLMDMARQRWEDMDAVAGPQRGGASTAVDLTTRIPGAGFAQPLVSKAMAGGREGGVPGAALGAAVGFTDSFDWGIGMKTMFAMASTAMDLVGGVKGKSRDEVVLGTIKNLGQEWSSPMGGVFPPTFSAPVLKLSREMTEHGRSEAEQLQGIVRPALLADSFGSRMFRGLASTVYGLQSPSGMEARGLESDSLREQSRGTSFGRLMYRVRGGGRDDLSDRHSNFSRKLNSQIAVLGADGYSRFLRGGPDTVGLSASGVLRAHIDLHHDVRVQPSTGGLVFKGTPQTALGIFIRNQAGGNKELEQSYIEMAISRLDRTYSPGIEALEDMMGRREVHPSIVQRVFMASLRGKDSLISELADGMEKHPENIRVYKYIWDRGDVASHPPTDRGSAVWTQYEKLRKQFNASGNAEDSVSERENRAETWRVLGGRHVDLLPRETFKNLLGQ
jgi:hypothetical protein